MFTLRTIVLSFCITRISHMTSAVEFVFVYRGCQGKHPKLIISFK